VASSWILFFSYQDDARPNTHQVIEFSSSLVAQGIFLNSLFAHSCN